MAESRTKIAQELSPEELAAFCAALADVPHGQMAARIMELAAEKGIRLGKSAAYEFKNKEALPWLRRLELRRLRSQQIQEQSGDAAAVGRTFADEAAAELGQLTFDFVSELDGKLDLASEEGREIYSTLTKGIKTLRDADRAMIRQLQSQIADTKADLGNPQLSEAERAARMRARFGV